MLPVPHPAPGASVEEEEENVDLKQALEPLLLSQGFSRVGDNYRHDATGYELDVYRHTTESWICLYDGDTEEDGDVICEAKVTSPEHAVLVLIAYGLLSSVEVKRADTPV